MPHRPHHSRKRGHGGSSATAGSFNYARPWQVFLAAAVFVCCVSFSLQVGKEYQFMTVQENLEYHVNDLDGVEFERPQVSSDWGFFKKIANAVVKVVKAVVKTVKTVVNVVGMYLGIIRCSQQHYPIYPAANPWDLGIVQQANYEKPLSSQGAGFTPIAQGYINKMPFAWGNPEKKAVNMQVLDSKVISQWRMMLVKDKTTRYLWVCFRGTTSISNWVDNARKFFNIGTGTLNANIRAMGNQVKYWQSRYQVRPNSRENRLYGFVGHSAGGWYANKVATNYDVWRVTLNAYNTKIRSRRHLNFRTYRDPVSATDGLSNYACLDYCKKGHSNIDFINCWRGRYHAYTPVKYLDLWYHTYKGFSRSSPNPYPYVRMPNEVVNNRNIDPASVQYVLQNGQLVIKNGKSQQPGRANTAGWTKVFSCWGDRRYNNYGGRWYLSPTTLTNRAKNNYYQYLFVNPRDSFVWAISTERSNVYQRNVANGKALSYNGNGALSSTWARENIYASFEGGSQNFGYSCSNQRNPSLSNNIYWACGNGASGFHVIPAWKYCRWSWSATNYQNFAVDFYIKRTGPYPQVGPQANLNGWTKVYECRTGKSNSNFQQNWVVPAATLMSQAKTFVYGFMFVDPQNRRRWAAMTRPNNFFANNLRFGRALSYNGRSGLSRQFINGQVATSYLSLKENFAYSCGNTANPRFGNNIYWACGNGANGFHVIPSSKICRWSWPSLAENRIDMYVKVIGRWAPPPQQGSRSSD